QIMRLLQNLIANAIKYQPKGNTPQIHIHAADEGDTWLIAVRDNGLGIDKAFVDQVFEPFRRLHTWDAIRGTGLGLAVCRKIIENHGGKIWAESEAGRGSTFLFTLPKA
ncbi:MAG: GHKL domain-containing protein, partial [Asticcacaulis sp.]|nr:GHKL domain-containing protein [Asticcacaulis sp.]